MDNGCPECEKIKGPPRYPGDHGLCLDCQLEQADADVVQAMNRYEELKKRTRMNEIDGLIDGLLDRHGKSLDASLKNLDGVLTELNYLWACIDNEVEALTELQGEIYERMDKVAQALDLNRKEEKEKQNELSDSKTV